MLSHPDVCSDIEELGEITGSDPGYCGIAGKPNSPGDSAGLHNIDANVHACTNPVEDLDGLASPH